MMAPASSVPFAGTGRQRPSRRRRGGCPRAPRIVAPAAGSVAHGGRASGAFQTGCRYWVVLHHAKQFRQCQAFMNPPPLAGVPHPVDVEPIGPHMVETSERCIEFRAGILFHAGAVALDEAIASGPPLAPDIDRIIEWVGLISGRKRGFRTVAMKVSQAAMIACCSAGSGRDRAWRAPAPISLCRFLAILPRRQPRLG